MASFRRSKPIFTSILCSMCQVGMNNILHLIPLRKSLLTFSPCVDPVPLLWTKLISRNYEALYLSDHWLKCWSLRSRCWACSDGKHTQIWWRSNDEPKRLGTLQIRERERTWQAKWLASAGANQSSPQFSVQCVRLERTTFFTWSPCASLCWLSLPAWILSRFYEQNLSQGITRPVSLRSLIEMLIPSVKMLSMFWWTTYSNMVTIQRWTKEIKLQQRTESLSFFSL